MKPLLTTKWMLTGTLLAALGFNLSFTQHTGGIATADFASTLAEGVVEGKLHTARGVIPVKYIDNGEDKVLAIIPKRMTEGGVCDNCGYESISISVTNKSDIDTLNVELLKTLERTRNTVVSENANAEVEVTGETEDADVDYFASLEKCDEKSSDSSVLSCRASGFIKILKNRKLNIPEDAALEYYKDGIESMLTRQLATSRQEINRMRRSSVMPGQWFAFEDSLDSSDPQMLRQEVVDHIESLLSGLPSKQRLVRDRLLSTQTSLMKAEAYELQQTMVQSRDTTDPQMAMYMLQEGQYRRYDLTSLMNGMLTGSRNGLQLSDASSAQKNQYMTSLNNYTQQLYQGMNTNIYGFVDGGAINNVIPGASLDQRLQVGGRVSTLPVSQGASADLIFQQQRDAFAITQQAQSSVVTTPQTAGTVFLTPSGQAFIPSFEIPTNNTGIQFGTAVPITTESIMLRNALRTQYGQ